MSTSTLTDQAIIAALNGNWKNAIIFNEDVLKKNPEDTEALNRIAYAYLRSGKLKKAKTFYKKVIDIDKYNQIAKKNLVKLNNFKKSRMMEDQSASVKLNPDFFLEEPGKTKSVTLVNTAPFSLLSTLSIGIQVFLNPKKHTVEVRDTNNVYLGALPDDISFRLIRCLKAGCAYNVFIKNISKNNINIFIKEIQRGTRFKNQPTFIPQLSDYQASIHKELLSENEESDKKEPDESFT